MEFKEIIINGVNVYTDETTWAEVDVNCGSYCYTGLQKVGYDWRGLEWACPVAWHIWNWL